MSESAPHILVADDEAHIRDVVQYALEREGFRVSTAPDGAAALALVARGGFDLLVLDVLMPELDGLTALRRLREPGRAPVPVILLSSRGEELDRILGLELGADDYVPKPFSPRELATRVKAVLRRARPAAPPEAVPAPLTQGRLVLDAARFEVRVDGARVDLTVTEFGVLQTLLARPGLVLTRSQLIDRAYSDGHAITERTIDTHIRRIRAKLRPFGLDPIETVHGLGYRAADAPPR